MRDTLFSRMEGGGPASSEAPTTPEGNRRDRRLRRHLLGLALYLFGAAFLFRATFSHGALLTPDFFLSFPASSPSFGAQLYLSGWSPQFLGSAGGSPASLPFFLLGAWVGASVAALQAAVLIGFLVVGAFSLLLLLESFLVELRLAFVGGALFLLSPYLFIDVFNASATLPFDLLLPTILTAAIFVSRRPSTRGFVLLALSLGVAFAFTLFGPLFLLPALIFLPVSFGVARKSLRAGARSLALLWGATGSAIALNAPVYLAFNPVAVTASGLRPTYSSALAIIPTSYGFSAPFHFLSLLGAGLYPRYAGFYPPLSEWLLVGFALFAFAGIAFVVRCRAYREVGVLAMTLYAGCGAWIFLTAGGITLPLYRAIVFLTPLNYPGEFYAYIAIALILLASIALDGIAKWEKDRLARQRTARAAADPVGGGGTSPVSRARGHRVRAAIRVVGARPATVAACVLVLLLLAGPAGFYLESGDFKVFDAPRAFGFPPQWGATVPSAYPAMYDFLQAHGGILSARALILPFPGPAGAQFGPFSNNLFDQSEYLGGGLTASLIAAPVPSDYTTSVLNYLVANRTDQIGVLLGEASVKYVLVDLQANFTGPPTWTWGSLVGAPSDFLRLLRSQHDLVEVYASPLFVAFQNLDYRPYVTGAAGVVDVRDGTATVPLNRTVGSWSSNPANWSVPQPPNRIAKTVPFPNGYQVYGVNNSGVLNITFANATDSVAGSSTRFDNGGIALRSGAIPVGNQSYVVTFQQEYTGPSVHSGGSLSVSGYDTAGRLLWTISSEAAAPSSPANGTIRFQPLSQNPATTAVRLSVTFPYRFGSGLLATYAVSDLFLEVGRWPAQEANWSTPQPPNRISKTVPLPNGYQVYGANNSGVQNITFDNATDSIEGASTDINSGGLYVVSVASFPVQNQAYALRFDQNYTGSPSYLGAYVSVIGYNAEGAIIWGIPSYTVAPPTQPNVTLPFDPSLLNATTTSVGVAITFPYDFGSSTLTTYAISHLVLAVRPQWLPLQPSPQIQQLRSLPNGYQVYGVNNSGIQNITFDNATDSISASGYRLENNGGFFLDSVPIPVVNQAYVLRFDQAFTGPSDYADAANGQGSYVTVWGVNAQGAYLWNIPSYTMSSFSQPNVTLSFNPLLLNPNTTGVLVSIAFPTNFDSSTLTTYTVANLTLVETLPPLPSSLLAALPLALLPPTTALPTYAPIPTFDISNATASALAQAGTPVRQLCLGLCPSSASAVTDQLFFAYAALNLSGTEATVVATPTALAGEVVTVNGSLNAALATDPSPFSSLSLRAAGNGTVSVWNGPTELTRLPVASSSLAWVGTDLGHAVETRQLTLEVNGTVAVDALWLGPSTASVGAVPGSGPTVTSSSLTQYSGTLGNATAFVVLSQGFDPEWTMTVGSTGVSSVPVAGWENGFVVSRAQVGRNLSYTIVFTGQTYHLFLLGIQGATLAILLAALVISSVPSLSERVRRSSLRTFRRVGAILHRRIVRLFNRGVRSRE